MGEGKLVLDGDEFQWKETILLMKRLYGQSWVLTTEIIGSVLKPENKVQDAIELLVANGHVVQEIRSKGNCIALTEEGAIALRDKYYTREAKERLYNGIYDVTKWALPLATFLLIVLITYFQITTKSDVSQHKKVLRELDMRLRQVESQKIPQP